MARKTSSKVSDDEDDTCRHVEQNSTRPISPTSEEASKRAAVMSVDFDAILKHIGEMGPYQLVLYLMMCIPATLPAAFLAFNQECISSFSNYSQELNGVFKINCSALFIIFMTLY